MILKIFRIQELHEYSFMSVFAVEHNYINETTDLDIFVCTNDLLCRESASNCVPGVEVGRYVLCGTTPDPPSVQDDPPFYPIPEFTVYPNRVLETIASPADMETYTTDPGINKHGFYRAPTVAMIFNTEDLMNKAIELITEDVRKHVRAMGNQDPDLQIKTFSEITDDALRDYYFRG